ncbi:hypothetical protein [Bradyrhizobium aeschynomenes]|nr:hypothetical protein [Bradyrhizobium aeschynomenes]
MSAIIGAGRGCLGSLDEREARRWRGAAVAARFACVDLPCAIIRS